MEQKEKIRQRYRGANPDDLIVIPAQEKASSDSAGQTLRVAVYARVSTDAPGQTSSYELQKNHFQDVIARHPGWELIGIYADEGISGTSLSHRDSFLRMIKDCTDGKIDLIVTKSVSRFSRNVVDCIGYIRQLAALKPPVGVFFETEQIDTLKNNSEMMLSFIATLAQEESHTKSEIMNASIEMRFRRGIFLTPPLLGYDQDADGNLVINEQEAKTVRCIFFLYLYGYSCQKIAELLTAAGCHTKKGTSGWSSSSVLGILQNERHCGDVLAHKTWTPNYLDHRAIKNKQNCPQYLSKNHHEPIIQRDDFIAVQQLIRNARYGNRTFFPILSVIPEGALRGYVIVHPKWAGFCANDYRSASESVSGPDEKPVFVRPYSAKEDQIQLQGFEIVREQFFRTAGKITMTVSRSSLHFSTSCIAKSPSLYVELLVHPLQKTIVIRPSVSSQSKYYIPWARQKKDRLIPRQTGGSAFLPTLYELFCWKTEHKYRLSGVRLTRGAETVLLFDAAGAELLLPNCPSNQDTRNAPDFEAGISAYTTNQCIPACPKEWMHQFGESVEQRAHKQEASPFCRLSVWNTQQAGQPCEKSSRLNITDAGQLKLGISAVIKNDIQEVTK